MDETEDEIEKKTEIIEKTEEIVDNHILLDCYAHVTDIDTIYRDFSKIQFDEKDRLFIYVTFADIMLKKCMKTKGINGLKGWTYKINDELTKSISVGGRCKIIKKEILIGKWLLDNDVVNLYDIKDTILHEIAHANAWIKYRDTSHGPKWVAEAKRIGCNGNQCLPSKFSELVYNIDVYKCEHFGDGDKCVCVILGNGAYLAKYKDKPLMFCFKHRLPFVYYEQKPYVYNEFFDYPGYKPYRHMFGSVPESDLIHDGDLVEIDENGKITIPNICILRK